MTVQRFASLWRSLTPIGRDAMTGGYLRYAWSDAELACREWFVEEALDRELTIDTDRNGNLWAWWGDPAAGDAVVTGSHFDSVPHGGAFDGPLGIVSALLAVDLLRERGVRPSRPIGIVAFAEEEGSRFGVACLGSRLLTGTISAQRARSLVDSDGVSLARALGEDAASLGAEPDRLARLGAFVELHIEQGRALVELGRPVGVATAIWPHGRWRMDFTGEANHAGTTSMSDRHDPVLTFAYTVLAANKEARLASAYATVGRVNVEPNATNAIAAEVTGWLDARAAEQSTLDSVVEAVRRGEGLDDNGDGTGGVKDLDDYSRCRITSKQDFHDLYVKRFYFGCEADDPINAWAFNRKANPMHARLNAFFSSDIGHFDVPDMTEVVPEAYELVEHGLLDDNDFRDFMFTNAVRFWGEVNPDFFKGTVVEKQAAEVLARPR